MQQFVLLDQQLTNRFVLHIVLCVLIFVNRLDMFFVVP